MTSTRRSETTRKEASLSTEEQLALAIETLTEHVVLFDAEDRIVIANKAWRDLNTEIAELTKPGTRFEDHLRAVLEKGLAPNASGREEEWLRERMERHLNPSGPFEMARQDGRWIRIYEQRLPNNGTILLISDITESKRLEAALRESGKRYREIFDESPVGIWETDYSDVKRLIDGLVASGVTDLRKYFNDNPDKLCEAYDLAPVVDISHAFCEMYGAPNKQALIESTRGELESDEELNGFLDSMIAFKAGEADFEYQSQDRKFDGTPMITSCRLVIPPQYRHDWSRVICAIEDITERKRADEALQDRIEQLEEAQRKLEMQGMDLVRLADDLRIARDEARASDRAKSEFLAAMSHELRTPLNAIIGFSEIMAAEKLGPVGNTTYRDYAADINGSGQSLLGLINDILDLSKIDSGKDKLHEEKIEIPKIVRSALKLVGQRAELGGIKLESELPDQLPALRVDERKLKQILVNLLSNAIKFTDAGGVVMLKAWCRKDSGYMFQIVDTGIGIAPEDIPKALSRFGQIDGDLSRVYEGTGLGLPLTKALVELHGGVLDMQSELGVGTTVTVRFPAERIVVSPNNSDSLDVVNKAAS